MGIASSWMLALGSGRGYGHRRRQLTTSFVGADADGMPSAGPSTHIDISTLILDLQARGLRLETTLERRTGGAGPTDSGMLWVEGFPTTVPTDNAIAARSPYVLRSEDEGYGIYRDQVRLAGATGQQRPRFYDLTTADGIPYWHIALLHL